MGFRVQAGLANEILRRLKQTYQVYAPKRFPAQGRFAETDLIRYGEIDDFSEIVFDQKSDYSAKEVITPIQQAIFYFTEDEYRASRGKTKPVLIFARPCDINAQKVQAKIYAGNGGYDDLYYVRMRERVKFALMECPGGDDTCFCVSMGTNETDDYALAVRLCADGGLLAEVRDETMAPCFEGAAPADFTPAFVTENANVVTPPEIPDKEVLLRLKAHPVWKEFNGRCISCGACTMACSTCTCFTTRDVIYGDNPEVGERRRVSASCQIAGYDQMAGQREFRATAGDRMRFKILHKFHDFKARFGDMHMCVGCGRCTGRCPAYISVTATVEKVNAAVAEIRGELGR